MSKHFIQSIEALKCSSYSQFGTCPASKFCTRLHVVDGLYRCLILYHLYPDPYIYNILVPPQFQIRFSPEQSQNLFNSFYLDIFQKMKEYGPIDNLLVCGNHSFNLIGNVYVIYKEVNSAQLSYTHLKDNCYYAGRKIRVELSPISQISSAICAEIKSSGSCQDCDSCLYIHPLRPSPEVFKLCFPSELKSIPLELQKNEQ